MDIVRNIEYQKKYFGEIYNNYFMKNLNNEIAMGLEEDYSIEDSNYIVIKVDNFEEILDEIFYIGKDNNILEQYKELTLKKSIMTEMKIEKNTIVLPMAFKLNGNYIKLVKKVEKHNIKGATLIILTTEKLNLFEKSILKEKQKKIKYCKNLDEVKTVLIKFKVYYNEKKFLEEVFKEKQKAEKNTLDDNFKSAIGLEIINSIYKEIRSEKGKCEIYSILSYVKTKILLENEKVNNQIIKQFLREDINAFNKDEVFSENFFIIDELLEEKEKMCLELNELLRKLKIQLEDILNEKEISNLFGKLNEGELRNLNNLINKSSERLFQKIRSVL